MTDICRKGQENHINRQRCKWRVDAGAGGQRDAARAIAEVAGDRFVSAGTPEQGGIGLGHDLPVAR